MIGILTIFSVEKYFLAWDGVQYPRIFAIHSRIIPFYSRNFTFRTQEITNTLLTKFEGPYSWHVNVLFRMYLCKVFCPEAGPSLDMHYQCSTYLSLLDKRMEWGSMSSPFLTEQWSFVNTFHCTHRYKSTAKTTTMHPHTPNSSPNCHSHKWDWAFMGTTDIALGEASREMVHYRIHHTQPQASVSYTVLNFGNSLGISSSRLS